MGNYDQIAQLLVTIFERAYPVKDTKDYFATEKFHIDDIGKVLRFLGLAEESTECDLGWIPTPRLRRLIAGQLARSSQTGTFAVKEHDREFVSQIYHLATGNKLTQPGFDWQLRFCCDVLAIIGLLQKGGRDEFKPSLRMKKLVFERFAQLAAKEKNENDDQKNR